jgi:F-type H+-transporting ATPase subunit b
MAQDSAQPITTTEHVPAGGQGHGFPPFDRQNFPSQLFWLVLTFVALYVLMTRIALPRIESILAERRRRIDEDLAHAQRFKDRSDAALAAHEKALNDARGRAQALATETRANAEAEAEARRREVDSKLSLHIAEAERAIAAKRSTAMANVRAIAGEAASAIVERLIGSKPASHEIVQALDSVMKR